jgi:hypothetical protein
MIKEANRPREGRGKLWDTHTVGTRNRVWCSESSRIRKNDPTEALTEAMVIPWRKARWMKSNLDFGLSKNPKVCPATRRMLKFQDCARFADSRGREHNGGFRRFDKSKADLRTIHCTDYNIEGIVEPKNMILSCLRKTKTQNTRSLSRQHNYMISFTRLRFLRRQEVSTICIWLTTSCFYSMSKDWMFRLSFNVLWRHSLMAKRSSNHPPENGSQWPWKRFVRSISPGFIGNRSNSVFACEDMLAACRSHSSHMHRRRHLNCLYERAFVALPGLEQRWNTIIVSPVKVTRPKDNKLELK